MQTRLLLLAQKFSPWLLLAAALTIILVWLSFTPPGILGKADALGYAVCHRLEERSFHFTDGHSLPLCARCSGMYIGVVVGLAFQFLFSRRKGGMPTWQVIVPLLLFGLAFAFDGVNSYLYLMKTVTPGRLDFLPTFYVPNNMFRLLTGSGAGLGIAVALFPSFNQTVWKNWDPSPAMGSIKQLAVLVIVMLGLDVLILSDSDLVLYPAAIISAGGVLLVLTLVYAVLWVMITRQENTFLTFGQTWLPTLGGLTIALLQITATDLFRLWLTHTWGGFPLPLG